MSGLTLQNSQRRQEEMGMMNMGRFVEDVGNLVRWDAIDGILKVVVWKGNGK